MPTQSWPQIGLQAGNFIVTPDQIPTHLGTWDVRIKACLTLTNACSVGPVSQVFVVNPCLETNVVAGEITTVMSAPRLDFNSLSLQQEMGPFWPFTDTVDNQFPEPYNCGRIDYVILDEFKNELPFPPLVKLQDGRLIL